MKRLLAMAAASLLMMAPDLSSPAIADEIDDYVRAEMTRQHIPGLSLGIIRNGQPLRLQGFGLANIEHRAPVHPDTVFQTGSIGKMFTAAATMLLVEDGRLALDAPLSTYLPGTPAAWQDITLRHLLNHTAGIGRIELDLQREYTDDELLAALYAQPLAFAPGTRWDYSNEGYVLIGILIGKVAGQSYRQIISERIFLPLGMRTARPLSDEDIIMNRAAGYEQTPQGHKNQRWVSRSLNATADGSLYMSMLDYVKWDAAVAGRQLLKASSWQQMLAPARLANGSTRGYGFGWELERTADGRCVMGHSGGWQGFLSDMRRYDDDGITFVVLVNTNDADTRAILQGVAERFDKRYQ
ncbi:MAG: serine hydrolase domain-containing protein [Lautropia sp.]|nr:serine hydrolase domain-containing protein [Lautropia sp.]